MSKMNHVIGGGLFSHVRSHLALAAPSFGETAREIHTLLQEQGHPSTLHLTKMADPQNSSIVTADDLKALVNELVADDLTKIVFFTPALPENGQIGDVPSGKYAERLQSRALEGAKIDLSPAEKIVGSIRAHRKDIFLVACKTTAGDSLDIQYQKGLRLVKESHVNLVLANDTVTRTNMIVVPEEARYNVTTNREDVLHALVEMALARSGLHFTKSTVVDGPRVPWNSPEIPENLRAVVDFCIANGAYKPFLGKTAGHFAARGPAPGTFLTSARSSNFNHLARDGLLFVEAKGQDEIISRGGRPSVGGISQRIVFSEHPMIDNIVHMHVPMRPGSQVSVRDQRPYECGSHECGENTSRGLKQIADGVFAVMLDEHGPNLGFGKDVPAERVIEVIKQNFDLSSKTGGIFAPEYATA